MHRGRRRPAASRRPEERGDAGLEQPLRAGLVQRRRPPAAACRPAADRSGAAPPPRPSPARPAPTENSHRSDPGAASIAPSSVLVACTTSPFLPRACTTASRRAGSGSATRTCRPSLSSRRRSSSPEWSSSSISTTRGSKSFPACSAMIAERLLAGEEPAEGVGRVPGEVQPAVDRGEDARPDGDVLPVRALRRARAVPGLVELGQRRPHLRREVHRLEHLHRRQGHLPRLGLPAPDSARCRPG